MDNAKGKIISVIVPIYNAEKYLEKCLDSIVGQSYRHLEIILVNDGSMDRSGNICDRYAAGDRRIKVIHRENGGLSAARNAGLDIATGEYLGFVDSDDWLEIDMYQFLLDDLLSVGADIAVCGFFHTFDDYEMPNDKSFSYRVLERTDALKLLLKDRVMQNYIWCKLYKQELFEGIRMPEGRIFEDAFTQHLIFEKARKVVMHNVPKYHYLQREDSICGRIRSFMNEDYHAAFYERVLYFSGKGEKRLAGLAANTYLNHLSRSYEYHENFSSKRSRAEHRQKYAAFSRANRHGRFLRFREKIFHDVFFSDSSGALLLIWVYGRYRIIENVIRMEGLSGFCRKVFEKLFSRSSRINKENLRQDD